MLQRRLAGIFLICCVARTPIGSAFAEEDIEALLSDVITKLKNNEPGRLLLGDSNPVARRHARKARRKNSENTTKLSERVIRFPPKFSIGRFVRVPESGVRDDVGFPGQAVRSLGAHPESKRFRFAAWAYPRLGFQSGDAQGDIRILQGETINLLIRCRDTRHLSQLQPDAIEHLLIERPRGSGGLYRYMLKDIEHLTELQGLTLHALSYNALYGYSGWGPISFSDGDLEALQKLRSLRHLDLSRTTFPDAALRHIAKLKSLRVLDLGSTEVTEVGLERLATMPQLESLDLSRVHVSANGLAHLKRLPALKELSLGPISASSPALDHLQHFTALTHLRIDFTDASDRALLRFTPPRNLKHLALSSKRPITDSGLKSLAGLKQLESLTLSLPMKLAGPGLRSLARLRSLKDLSISYVADETNDGLASIADLTQLERLVVISVPNVAVLMSHLDGHPNLVELVLSGELDPEAETPKLTRGLPRLRRLNVPNVINVEQYAHAWLELVTQLTSLEELDLIGIDLATRQLQLLENLVHLRRLRIKPNAPDAGMQSLSRLASLQHLVLHNGGDYSDAGLKQLSRLKELKSLSMTWGGGGTVITDAGLQHLQAFKSLEAIDLWGAHYVSDSAVESLGRLTKLKRLNVRKTKLTADGAQRLRQALPDCQILDSFPDSQPAPDPTTGLRSAKLTIEKLALLKDVTNLEVLSVNTDHFRDIGLQHLKSLKQAESLELSGRITNADLVQLNGVTNLRHLTLGSDVTDAGMKHLARLTCLQSLSLTDTQVTTKGLRHLKGLTRLEKLWPPKNAGLEHLSELTSLQVLYLSRTKLTDAELKHISGLTNLQVLYARGPEIGDLGLEHLKGLTNLHELSLSGTRVTSKGLQHLREMTELRTLGLHRTQVTDAGLAYLTGLSNLEFIGLDNCQVTDAGLKHLGQLKKLKSVMIQHTQVTDAGLVHLQGLEELSDLRFSGTRVTAEGIATLREHLPLLDR